MYQIDESSNISPDLYNLSFAQIYYSYHVFFVFALHKSPLI